MEDNHFFKFVWRFNAIILMMAGILAIGVLLFAGYHIFQDITRERTARNIVNVVEGEAIDEKWELGRLYKVEGTQFVMIPLTSDQSYAQSYYSKSTYSIRNYLFIDTITNEKQWLFESNEYLVTNIDYLSDKEYNTKGRTVRAILYTVIEKDTNGDNRLTEKDEMTLAITLPSGKPYKKILTAIDNFIGYQVLSEENMLLVYQKQGVGFSANLSLSNFSIHNEKELPKIKKS